MTEHMAWFRLLASTISSRLTANAAVTGMVATEPYGEGVPLPRLVGMRPSRVVEWATIRTLACFLALLPAAACAATTPIGGSSSAPASTEYWLRPYPLEPYTEYWHINLTVRDLKKTLPAVVALLEKRGGQSNIPLTNAAASDIHHYQQLSYKLTTRNANKVVKAIKKLGKIESLTNIPASSLMDMPEVQKKLSQLRQESASNREALARMPAISEIVSELTNHLSLTERVYAGAKDRVLLNIELQEAASK